jgi:hypothetical protein
MPIALVRLFVWIANRRSVIAHDRARFLSPRSETVGATSGQSRETVADDPTHGLFVDGKCCCDSCYGFFNGFRKDAFDQALGRSEFSVYRFQRLQRRSPASDASKPQPLDLDRNHNAVRLGQISVDGCFPTVAIQRLKVAALGAAGGLINRGCTNNGLEPSPTAPSNGYDP